MGTGQSETLSSINSSRMSREISREQEIHQSLIQKMHSLASQSERAQSRVDHAILAANRHIQASQRMMQRSKNLRSDVVRIKQAEAVLLGSIKTQIPRFLPLNIKGLKLPDEALLQVWFEAPQHLQNKGLLAFTKPDPKNRNKVGTISRCHCVRTSCSRVFCTLPSQSFPIYMKRRGPDKGTPKFMHFCPSCSQAGHSAVTDQLWIEKMLFLIGYKEKNCILSTLPPQIYDKIAGMLSVS